MAVDNETETASGVSAELKQESRSIWLDVGETEGIKELLERVDNIGRAVLYV